MNDAEFITGISRIQQVFGEIPEEIRQALNRRWHAVDGRVWIKVCDWVIDNSHHSPRPAKFAEGYRVIVGPRSSDDPPAPPYPFGCEDCANTIYYFCKTLDLACSGYAICRKHQRDRRHRQDHDHIHEPTTFEQYDAWWKARLPAVVVGVETSKTGNLDGSLKDAVKASQKRMKRYKDEDYKAIEGLSY